MWVASRSDAGDSLLGAGRGCAERPDVRYVVRDWLAKLQIVAAGLAITTLAPIALDVLPAGVAVVAVRGEPQRDAPAGARAPPRARSTARPRGSPTRSSPRPSGVGEPAQPAASAATTPPRAAARCGRGSSQARAAESTIVPAAAR